MNDRPGNAALVLGLGRFGGGREAARFLLRRGWTVRISDRAPREQLADQVAALEGEGAIEWRLGEPQDESLLDGVGLVVANPAVRSDHPVLVAARELGATITQELNLFLEAFPGRSVLVTGTNGKTTTATLLAQALRRSGIPTLLGGNLGHSLLADERSWSRDTVAVVEASSFQLERLDPTTHSVEGAVFTPVTRDHLDRHGTLEAYHAAKGTAAAAARAFVVHLASDPVAAGYASRARRRVTCTRDAPATGQVGCAGGWIVSRLEDVGPVLHPQALQLPGEFQTDNAMLACAAATMLGAGRHHAGLAVALQRPLPYRLNRLLCHDGVELYDNSVSTEATSTASALATLSGQVHWVGGGKSKDGDYESVAEVVAGVRSAHLFGAAAEPLRTALQGRTHVTAHTRLEDALDAAWGQARPGDRVLFSPAFASFDQFANFRSRAEAFHTWASRLRSRTPGTTGSAT